MRRSLLLVALLFLSSPSALAQTPFASAGGGTLSTPSQPVEWGEVSMQRLKADTYPPDSAATAVYVSEYGDLRVTQRAEVEMDVHVRIKILSESGYDAAEITRTYLAEDGFQDVDDVEGTTYTLGDDGQIQTTALAEEDVFVEDLSRGYEQVTFTLPNLEPGAIVEYRYTLESDSPIRLPEWTFQHDEPTLYSQYDVRAPKVMRFIKLARGSHPFAEQSAEVDNATYGKAQELTWVMKDVPALREEPYMTTPRDYQARLKVRARSLTNPRTGAVMQEFMSTWSALAERLMDDDEFGRDLGDDDDVGEKVAALVADSMSATERAEAMYDYVRTSVSWKDAEFGIYADRDLDDVLEAKSGTGAEVNLLLVAMLRHAGLDAHPVLLATRSYGRPSSLFPAVDQFNHVIAAVERPDRSGESGGDSASGGNASGGNASGGNASGGNASGGNASGSQPMAERADDWLLMDATDPLCPMGLLPERDLNREVWLVRPDNPIWIPLQPSETTLRSTYVKLALGPDGTLEGRVSVKESGYDALDSRTHLREADADDATPAAFLREELLDVPSATVSDAQFQGLDDVSAPLVTQGSVSTASHVQTAGDRLYVPSLLATRFDENPFTASERTFPIDFAHSHRTVYTLSMKIPDGYAVEELPENRRMKIPQNVGTYTYLAQADDGRVMIRSTLSLARATIAAEHYGLLREFFSRLVSTQSNQIVLQKTDSSGSDTATDNE